LNRSGSPGITVKDVFPQFKKEYTYEVDPIAGTYYPILSVSGRGALYGASVSTNDAVTAITRTMRITIDGVAYLTMPSAAEAGADAWYFTEMTSSGGVISKTNVGPHYIPFKDSLLVEVKTDIALVAGKNINGNVWYGEA